MANLLVNGGKPLSGTIIPSGNKNAMLPILCATVLTDEIVTLRNVPNITDVQKVVRFLGAMGSKPSRISSPCFDKAVLPSFPS